MSSDLGIESTRRRLGAPKRNAGHGSGGGGTADVALAERRGDDRGKDDKAGKGAKSGQKPGSPQRRFAKSLMQDPKGGLPIDRAHLKKTIEKYYGKAFGTAAPEKQGLERIEKTINRLTSPAGDPNAQKALDDIKELLKERPKHAARILEDMGQNLDKECPDTGGFGDPENRKGLFREVIGKLAHPDQIYQGRDTSDCGPAVVQTILAKANPMRYWKMARDLMSEGQFAMGEGAVPIKGNPSAIPFPGDATRRSPLDTLMQRSLFRYAKDHIDPSGPPFGGTGDESEGQSNALRPSGSRARPRGTGGTGLFGGENDDGLSVGQIKGLLNTVLTDGNWKAINMDKLNERDRLGAWQGLKKRLRPDKKSADDAQRVDSEQLGVPVGVYTKSGAFHEVLVKRVRNGTVTFFDPATRRAEKMPEKDFLASVSQMLLPKDQPIDLRDFDFRPRRRPPADPPVQA